MAHVVPDLPSSKASQALFSTYYLALVDDYDPVKTGMTTFETAEMTALLALVPRASVTKLFCPMTNSGSWNTAGNWYPSGVPAANAKVCIPEGVTVTTGPNDAVTKLFTVRCDGKFYPDETVDMAILFDTWVTTPMGSRRSGTPTSRVPQGKTHRYIIATSNGDIDTTWDTFMQSRGMIEMGASAGDFGVIKTRRTRVAAYTGPAAGATSLTLEEVPVNWQVGDEIIIPGTICSGQRFSWTTQAYPYRDEKRTLTSITNGGLTMNWSGGLTWDHIGFAATANRPEFKCYVGNLTCNVIVEPDTDNTPIQHRGHTMQMHNPLGGSASHKRFRNIGRTAKHGGNAGGSIVFQNGAHTGGVAFDLTTSAHWNGTAIVLSPKQLLGLGSFTGSGPAFLLDITSLSPAGSGTLTIQYTDQDGAPGTLVINYTASANQAFATTAWMTAIQSITPSTNFNSFRPIIKINARSRQINENGVRDMHTSLTSTNWTYDAARSVTNSQGRYPNHLHKLGISGGILTAPPRIIGCVMDDSPAWCGVQHQTHADWIDNVFYNFQGAGLVAEDGNETGLWEGNLSVHGIGNDDISHKVQADEYNLDPARSATCYWFTGRQVRVFDNVAAGGLCGFAYNARLRNVNLTVSEIDQPQSFRTSTSNAHIDFTPLAHFTHNVAVTCRNGILTIRSSPNQNHDLRTIITDNHTWSTEIGIELDYTINYTMARNKCLSGFITGVNDAGTSARGDTAFQTGVNTTNQVFMANLSEGFSYGYKLTHAYTDGTFVGDPLSARHIIDPVIVDCTNDYYDFTVGVDQALTSGDLNLTRAIRLSNISMTYVIGSGSSGYGEWRISGNKTDERAVSEVWPFGVELDTGGFEFGAGASQPLLTTYFTENGYWTDGATKKARMYEWFSSTITGELDLEIHFLDVTSFVNITNFTNRGNMSEANTVAPVLADFTVTNQERNQNIIIDVLGRASHPGGTTMELAGFQRPMRGYVKNNGDGTITYVPRVNANYSESFTVIVIDINGNRAKASCTVNVNKQALFLGRADQLAV